ncbi:MAG: branched-chain amino acid ABC transporter permease, partial [Caldimonas sp.]
AVIGAMMFYGRISDVYMGVITLVVTLILFKFMNATAGDAYRIGSARLGGFNGIPAFPVLNVPGDPGIQIFGTPFYYVVAVLLLLCYLLCHWILGSYFGRVLIGIRENEARVELLGYSAPLYKTAIFTISAAMAGLAGCLFANWAEIVTPGVFSLGQSAEVIIWTIVGGLGTLAGPIIGAIVLGYLKLLLGQQTLIDNSLVLGFILVLVVLLLPSGLLPALTRWRHRRERASVSRRQASSTRRRRGQRGDGA